MKVLFKMLFIALVLALTVTGGAISSYAVNAKTLTGRVIETMDSGGYTYARIENKGVKTWVAVRKTKVVKGQNISFAPGMEMQNFESKTLKRKFDKIIFSDGVIAQGEKGTEKKSPDTKGSAKVATKKMKVDADAKALKGKVIESMDSGGYTYVQIENDGGKTWVAVPKTKVVKGQNVSFAPGNEMQNFESKTLKRKFDKIIFSGGVIGQNGK